MSMLSIAPYRTPRIVLSDGTRSVIFNGISHVACSGFYDDIRADIQIAKSQGATYLYEGVPIGNKAEAAELASSLMDDLLEEVTVQDIYRLLARVTGTQLQPQKSFLDLPGKVDVNADITGLEQLALIRGSDARKKSQGAPGATLSSRHLKEAEDGFQKLSPRVQRAVAFFGRHLLVTLTRVDDPLADPLKRVINDARSKVLADKIVETPGDLIVTYGAKHLETTLAALKAAEPAWHVVEQTWRRPF